MSFEDDMIEFGFTDGNDYMDYLYDEAEKIMKRQAERKQEIEEYEEWLNSLSDEELEELQEEELRKKQERERKWEEQKEMRLKKERERKENELLLKQWIIENWDVGRIWYAKYSSSTNSQCDEFDSFLEKLGNDDYGFEDAYRDWYYWMEQYEEYQEFKEKAPEEWKTFSNSVNSSYVMSTIGYEGYDIEENSDYVRPANTKKVFGLLKKWIEDNKLLWNNILANKCAKNKSEEVYMFQAWMDNFYFTVDTFDVWKVKNPEMWKERKKWTELDIFSKMTKLKFYYDEKSIFYLWIRENEKYWNSWKKRNEKYWQERYEEHRVMLWYVYTESKWEEYLYEKKKQEIINKHNEEYEQFLNSLNEDPLDILEDEFEDLDLDELYIEEDEDIDLGKKLGISYDPRNKHNSYNYSNEIEWHRIMVDEYYNGCKENPEKKYFIDSQCSEKDMMSLFFKSDNIYHERSEEHPETYAKRKLEEYWRLTHKKQWWSWLHYFLWRKNEGRTISYRPIDKFYAWKQMHKKKWESWIQKEYAQYKSMAESVDLWYSWLSDKDNYKIFECWAENKLKDWKEKKDYIMKWDMDTAYKLVFNYPREEFSKWKYNNVDEWNYWKPIIEERLLMNKFEFASLNKPYTPQFKIKLKAKELRLRALGGKDVFHDNLAKIYEDGKYGFVNKKEELIIKNQYDMAYDFVNGIAAVKVGERSYKVYDSRADMYYEDSYGGKWGLINTKGEFLISPKFDDVKLEADDLIFYSIGGKIDKRKHEVKGSKWGIMNGKLEEIVEAKYTYLWLLEGGLILARIDNGKCCKFGLMEKNGQVIIPFKYASLSVLKNGLVVAGIGEEETNLKYGLLTKDGKELTHFKYSDILDFRNGLMLANTNGGYKKVSDGSYKLLNGEWGYLDINGKETIPFVAAYDMEEFLEKENWRD